MRQRGPVQAAAAMGLLLSITFALAPAGAGETGAYSPAPTVVEYMTYSVDPDFGGLTTVEAKVDFGGTPPEVLGTRSGGGPLPAGAGLDVRQLVAYVEDGDVPEATFVWRLAQLDRQPPPETVRYFWNLDTWEGNYVLQAKRSDVLASAYGGDPVGDLGSHVAETLARGEPPAFALQGACTTVVAVRSCEHLAWVDGEFDLEHNEVRIRVPLDLPAAPGLHPEPGGWVLAPATAGASVQAGADHPATSVVVEQTEPWAIPGRWIGFFQEYPDGERLWRGYMDPDGDGVWRLTVDTFGLGHFTMRLRVRACLGHGVWDGEDPPPIPCTDLVSNWLEFRPGEVVTGTVSP